LRAIKLATKRSIYEKIVGSYMKYYVIEVFTQETSRRIQEIAIGLGYKQGTGDRKPLFLYPFPHVLWFCCKEGRIAHSAFLAKLDDSSKSKAFKNDPHYKKIPYTHAKIVCVYMF